MKVYLTKPYRLIWNSGNLIIQNDYEKDYMESVTTLITKDKPPDVIEPYLDLEIWDYFESDTYSDITDKITELGLQLPPNEEILPPDLEPPID